MRWPCLKLYVSGVIGLRKRGESIVEAEDPGIDKEAFELIHNVLLGLNRYCGITIPDLAKSFAVKPEFLSVLIDKPMPSF